MQLEFESKWSGMEGSGITASILEAEKLLQFMGMAESTEGWLHF